jgi:hypothetical protein
VWGVSRKRTSVLSVALTALLSWAALVVPSSASAAFAPLASFGMTGSSGDAAGQLHNPAEMVVDSAGNLFVADVSNNRISEFAATGAFVRSWGYGVATGADAFEVCTTASGCQAGIEGGQAGQLSSPYGLAVDGAGNLYVGETGNDRISQFTSSGTFVRAWGYGVENGASALQICTTATTCQAGLQGDAAGQFAFPEGVAIDGTGNLFVAGGNNNRIDEFTTGGAFVRAWGYGVDTGASAFEICTSASGCQEGLFGSAAGQLQAASELDADGAGNLYVGERGTHRVSQFTTGGSFVKAWGFGVDTGSPGLEICTTASGCQAGIAGAAAGQVSDPIGVAADGGGNVYIADEDNNRGSQFTAGGAFVKAWGFGVDSGASSFEACTIASACQIGLDGSGAGQLSEPFAAGTDCRGAVYIVDDVNANVQRFGEAGTAPPPCPPASNPAPPPGTTPAPSAFNLAAAIKRCKKKFRKGSKARKKCVRKARRHAGV